MNPIKNKAFTLTEVLIALGIIGIIAALTIPILYNTYEKKAYVIKLKESFSILYNATQQLIQENGGTDLTGNIFMTGKTTNDVLNAYISKLKIINNCGTAGGCFYTGYYKNFNGVDRQTFNTSYSQATLINGVSIAIATYANDCTTERGDGSTTNPLHYTCAEIWIDTNGIAAPNVIGRDAFGMIITKTGLYPIGTIYNAFNSYKYWAFSCNPAYIWPYNGYGCTSRVLQENDINY